VVFAAGVADISSSSATKSVVEETSIFSAQVSNLTHLQNEADLIVEGRVVEIGDAEWDTPTGSRPENVSREDVTEIHREVRLDVTRVLKGEPRETVNVRVSGGKTSTYDLRDSSAPNFTKNEEVILFLREYQGEFIVYGGENGKLQADQIVERNVFEEFQSTVNTTRLADEIAEDQ